MTRVRASSRTARKRPDVAGPGQDRDEAVEAPSGPQLTVSYQRWCAALQEDDLLFVECLLTDVRRLLEAGGTLVVVGLSRSSVVIRDLHDVNDFAAQIAALHPPRA
jgi:hypothetical protein